MAHSSYLSTYRLDGYAPRLHMSVYQPPLLGQGTLTATPDNPDYILDYSWSSSPSGSIYIEGQRIVFRDGSTDLIKGYGRVQTVSSSYGTGLLGVRDLSQAIAPVVSGDKFDILGFTPLDTKLIANDYSLYPDHLNNPAWNDDPLKIMNSGSHWAGWTDSALGYALVTARGSDSFQVNQDGTVTTTIPNRAWGFVSGSGVTYDSGSSSTDSNPVFRVTAGSRFVQQWAYGSIPTYLYVNSLCYIAHDKDNPPHEVILKDYSGDMDRGVNWTVEVVYGDVDEATIPEGMLVILWQDDYNSNGTVNLYRTDATNRSHIIGIGYIRRVTSEFKGEDQHETSTFEIQSPLMRLSEIAAYSNRMEESNDDDEYYQVKTLGIKRGILHEWAYYTTGMEAGFDFVIDSNYSDGRYPKLYIQRSDPISQMREFARARNARIVQIERGARFELQTHPALVELADRP